MNQLYCSFIPKMQLGFDSANVFNNFFAKKVLDCTWSRSSLESGPAFGSQWTLGGSDSAVPWRLSGARPISSETRLPFRENDR